MSIPGLITIGTCASADEIMNQAMITRTPNGDLYASAGAMGQNHDLDPSKKKPIHIWYSNDDGATWVVSREIYVDSDTDQHWVFGGMGAACIASDADGYVHIAFGIRRRIGAYPSVKSNNVVIYLHGKHGNWGGIYNIFQADSDEVLDCRPSVASLAVDSNNLAHLLFSHCGIDTEYIRHIWDPGTGWFLYELLHYHGDYHCHDRLVIDSNDTIHVTYGIKKSASGVTVEKFYYKAKAISGGWGNTVYVGMDSDPWYYGIALAIDKDDNLHMATAAGGQYRQRSSAGVWSDIEDYGLLDYSEPSISIPQDGVIYVAARKSEGTWGRFNIRKRVDGVWSDDESWTYDSYCKGVCMLHSYYPKIGTQYTNILETGWAFHWRMYYGDSYYKADFTQAAYVTTDPATLVTGTTATINGTLVYDGDEDCTCSFEWGLTTDYGEVTTGETKNTGETFSAGLTGLLAGTVYHFRAKAVNSLGTFYGADLTFTTVGTVYPSVATTRVSSLVHRWVPGSYTLEMVLGGLTSEFGLIIPTGKPAPTIPTLPSCQADEVLTWSLERGYYCMPRADIPIEELRAGR